MEKYILILSQQIQGSISQRMMSWVKGSTAGVKKINTCSVKRISVA
jgi:hypothetical protein